MTVVLWFGIHIKKYHLGRCALVALGTSSLVDEILFLFPCKDVNGYSGTSGRRAFRGTRGDVSPTAVSIGEYFIDKRVETTTWVSIISRTSWSSVSFFQA